jgi:autotransporter-associated beta strand protein
MLLLANHSALADVTNTIPASANAYVYRGSASSDQSEAQTLSTKRLNDSNTRISYVRFDVSSFLSSNSIANLTGARLRLYYAGGVSDTIKVHGLLDANMSGVSDGAWSGNMTWNNQPAKTASPNDIPGTTSGLPNDNTTAQLGSQSFASTAGEVSISLSVGTLQQLLLADSNQQITLLFYTSGNNTPGWASIANTSGFLVPTLELVALPSAGPPALLTWDGTLNGNWDTNTANWKTNSPGPATTFKQQDEVTFDDSKTGTSAVNLTTTVTPSRITFSNSTASYTLNGSGRISGIMGFTKQGSGTLTISTSNDFAGPIFVSAGILKASNASAFGTGAGTTVITNGATLDVNGMSLVTEPVRVSGAGISNNGVIINSGAQQTSALRDVTLLGDATFGGTGRWDIRNTGGNASLDTLGQARSLIKVGTNQFSLVGVSVDSKLANIEVRQGVFSVETSTSGLGNPNNTLSVSNGATFQLYSLTAVPDKNILLAGGATFFNNSGANRFSGAITLQGNATINVAGSSLTLNDGIGGPGGLIKTGSSTLTVNGTSSYTGGTTLSAGKLELYGNIGGLLTAAAGTTLAGTFNNNAIATISGSVRPGDDNVPGTITASGLTLNSGATVTFELFPDAVDLLQVNGDLTLNNNTVTIAPLAMLQTNVPYRLVNYTGARIGSFNPALVLNTNFSASLDYSTTGRVNVIFTRVQNFTIPTQYPTGPGPANITVGADGKLIYWPDPNGDTIPDFSKCGYRGGEVPIPNVPVVTNLFPIVGNNFDQIQGAIETLKTLPLDTNGLRGAILLAPGIYDGSGTISVNGSGIVLRGSGESTNGTILRGMSISINDGSRSLGSTTYNVMSDYVPVGANWFTVDTVSGLVVGDEIKITRPSNGTWLDAVYPPGGKDSWIGAVDNILYRKIVAIEDKRVMIDSPLVMAFNRIDGYGGASFKKATYNGTENSGIEYLRVDRGNSTPDTNGNTGGVMMDFGGVQNCWVRHLYNDRMNGHTMDVGGARYITIEDVTSFHMPLIYRESSATVQNFTFSYGGQGLLFHRCVTSYGGSEFTSGPAGSGPTVFLECTIPGAVAFTGPHMKFTCGVLYDTLYANQQMQTFKNDGSHGFGGANEIAWNCEASGYHFDRPPTAHQWNIGCIGSVSADEPRSGALPCERISHGKHVEPGSLFRAQLAERIGQEKAFAVLGAPDGANPFTLVALPETNSVAVGQNVDCPILMSVPPDYGGQTVTFSFNGLPAGVSASFVTSTRNSGGTNLLNVIASNSAPVGSYLVTVKGTGTFPVRGGGSALTTRSITFLLKITGPNNFFVSAAPFFQSVELGTNTSFNVKVTSTNGFSAAVALSVAGLPAGVSSSFNPPTVNSAGSSVLTLTASNNAPATASTLTIIGNNSGLNSGATVKLTVGASGSLPDPWVSADVGAPPITGNSAYTNGAFTVKGCGADIWSTSDQFQFAYIEDTGDLTITARVVSQSNTDPWAKAGVMIRESTNANSKYIAVYVTPTSSHGVSLQYRATTGGSAMDVSQISGPVVPYWVRLVRSTNTFRAYRSVDGQTWTQVGTNITAVSLPANTLVGLAVCSHNTGSSSTVTFDNVSVAHPDFDISATQTSQSISAGDVTAFTLSVTGTNFFSGVVGLTVDGLPAGANGSFSPAAVTNSGNSTLTITTATNTPPGDYDLVISGTNGGITRQETVTLEIVPLDSDGDGIPDSWMQQYFGHPTGQAGDLSRADDDADGDRMSNLSEYLCGSNPTNAASYLHLTSVTHEGDDMRVKWLAAEGKSYYVEAAQVLGDTNGFTVVSPLVDVTVPGESVAEFLHLGGNASQASFYRIRLEP